MIGCGAFSSDLGFATISVICALSICRTWKTPAVAGESRILTQAGREKIKRRIKGKFLKMGKIGPAASIASMIGALKPGELIASTLRAKQKDVITSLVKQRNPRKRSELFPSASFTLRTSQR